MTYRENGERKIKDLLIEIDELFMCYDDEIYEAVAGDFEHDYYPVIELCEAIGEWDLAVFLRAMDARIFSVLYKLAEGVKVVRHEIEGFNLFPLGERDGKDWSD